MHLLLRMLPIWLAVPSFALAGDAEDADFSALLPADTLAFLESVDREGRETALDRLCAEPEVRAFVGKLEASLRAGLARQAGAGFDPLAVVGLEPADFEGIGIRRAGAAVVDVELVEGRRPSVDGVLLLEFGKGAERGAKIVEAACTAIAHFVGPFETVSLRGREVRRKAAGGFEVYLLREGARTIVTTRRARMESVLAALDGAAAEEFRPLSANARFAAIRARMQGDDHAWFAFLDVRAVAARGLAIARRRMDADAVARFETIWNKLGLDAVEAVAGGDFPSGDGFRTELAVTLRERRGLFALFQDAPTAHPFAGRVPAGAMLYGAERIDLPAYWDGIVGLAGSFAPAAAVGLEGFGAGASRLLGVDLRRDVFGALGDEWAGYVAAPPHGGLLPDVALLVAVKDEARLARALDTVLARLRGAAAGEGGTMKVRETTFRGTRVRYLELALDDEPVPIAPAWTIVDGTLVVALWPQTVKHALAEREGFGSGPRGLLGREDFAELRARVPEGAVSATYVDLGRLVPWVYNTLVPLAQVMGGAVNAELRSAAVELDLAALPPADVIARHLGGVMGYACVGDDCIRIGYVSDFGAPLVLAPAAALGVAVAATERGRRAGRFEELVEEREEATRAARIEELEEQLARERGRRAALEAGLSQLEREVAELRRLIEERTR